MDRNKCEDLSCEAWAPTGCTVPNEYCSLDDKQDVRTIGILTEVVAHLPIGELEAIYDKHGVATPEECGYEFEDVDWYWKVDTDFPTWEVPEGDGHSKEVRGLGDE